MTVAEGRDADLNERLKTAFLESVSFILFQLSQIGENGQTLAKTGRRNRWGIDRESG